MSYELPAHLHCLGTDVQPEELRYHDKRVTVTKEFTFDAAHHLHAYAGKCQNLHGHTYRLRVSVSDTLDKIGLAIDFADVKDVVTRTVIDRLDHQYLNAVLPPMNTTAENIVVWIYETVAAELSARGKTARMEKITLWETPSSSVEITRAAMEE